MHRERIIGPQPDAPPQGAARRWLTRLLLLALFLPGTATSQEAAAQKQFSMPPFAKTLAFNFRAVGRVNKGGFNTRGSCSGTLIRPDVVLTAGHCAAPVREASENRRMFVAGWSRGEYVAAREIVEAVRHPAYLIAGRHDPRFDVGLLFLDSPITEVAPIPMGEPAHDVVGVAGYHRFIPHLLTGRLNCPVLARNHWILRIDCPVVSGNSGGPVLEYAQTDPASAGAATANADPTSGWRITAVVSSQEKGPRSLRAIAVVIPQWVHDVLAER